MSNDKIDAPIEKENKKQASFFDNKVTTFIKEYSNQLLILAVTIFIIVLIVVIYNISFAQSDMEDFAEDFCNCASEFSEPAYYAYSKDKFGYRNELKGCFEEDFRRYGQNFNRAEKKKLLIEFQQAVVRKCPQKLANVFEYK